MIYINISNKAVWSIAFLILIIAGGIFVTGVGVKPNPGHALAEVQGYFDNDANLLETFPQFQMQVSGSCGVGEAITQIHANGSVECGQAGSTPGVNCTTYTATSTKTISCTSGEIMVSGGAECVDMPYSWAGDRFGKITDSYPSGNGWFAQCTDYGENQEVAPAKIYVRCCLG